jgi:hypothetical protein
MPNNAQAACRDVLSVPCVLLSRNPLALPRRSGFVSWPQPNERQKRCDEIEVRWRRRRMLGNR